ncbi:MAG: Oxidoreductase family, NAD-binding Rossmann fold protein [Candidatus Uhrbacteria bacterium GW2011_GWF2_39_13]|uniref:Oxidoreductase family, NAD-binding Rossmann fold protein n=1 Tax=Candidatus Uhrbacteria bacterium GW2011_GWF2_39_13 TaxID=1618995 RepID=A0A0G0MWC2_9BACT|nr:MAG: Oxidoreductase family, NAD-binding Rossmann fold protein [Candidatus Uhrbacteria bacterium GW2011_GWF2_39_13]
MKKMVIVGFGFMGVVHAKNIIASDKLELLGIVDNRSADIFADIDKTGNQGNCDLPLERLKQTPVYKTLDECCKIEKPDAVSICVPLFMHYELTKKALNLGLDVLLEKPFCPELGQCRELIELAEEKNRIMMVAHCVRFAPAWKFLAERIRDKCYGELKLLTTTRMCGEPTWGVWLDTEIKKTCGGSLFDLLIHDIDFANSCLGLPENIEVNLKVDEYWELLFRYNDNQAKVSIKGGFLYQHTPFVSEYAATFEKGSIRFSSLQSDVIHIGTDKGNEFITMNGDAYQAELEYFAKCIENRSKPERCLPVSSLQAIEICRNIRNTKHT